MNVYFPKKDPYIEIVRKFIPKSILGKIVSVIILIIIIVLSVMLKPFHS